MMTAVNQLSNVLSRRSLAHVRGVEALFPSRGSEVPGLSRDREGAVGKSMGIPNLVTDAS